MSDLVERLRGGLSMSMFASRADLHESELDLRMQAADEIERLRNALDRARSDINWMLNARQFLNGHCFDYIDAAMQTKEGA